MLSFKQFVLESIAHLKVQHNISIAHLKAFTKTEPSGQVRYMIDHQGKLHAGAADQFVHYDLVHHDYGGHGETNDSIRGYIQHKEGKLIHHVAYRKDKTGVSYSGKDRAITHPILDKMRVAGITRVHHELDFEQ